MQSVDFERLRIRLLKGGVAPKFVLRTVNELRRHLDDLAVQERSAGVSETAARAEALKKLGDEDRLVSEALAKRELQSWSRRFTRSFYLLVPIAAYFACVFAIYFIGSTFTSQLVEVDIYNDWPAWHFWLSKVLLYFIEYLLTPLLAAAIAVTAIRRNVEMLWPFVGILLLCFFGQGIDTFVTIPDERGRGGLSLLWGWPFLPWEYARPPLVQSLEQFLRVIVTMAMVVFAFKRYRPYEKAN